MPFSRYLELAFLLQTRPKLENIVSLLKVVHLHFKVGAKMVSSALCYNFLKHIKGRDKKGQEYGITRNEARKTVFRLRKSLGQICFFQF